MLVEFDGREVAYGFGELDELVLAYATTIHKAQGSEYPAVVIPLTTQHYPMLRRNLRLHGRDPGQAARGDRRSAQGDRNRGSRRSVAPTLVEAQGVARYQTADQGGVPVSFAIIRGSNGRRHEVDFGDAEIEVDVAIGSETVQITVEAVHDLAPSDKRRFATIAIPREKLAAALGADLRERHRRRQPDGLRVVPSERLTSSEAVFGMQRLARW